LIAKISTLEIVVVRGSVCRLASEGVKKAVILAERKGSSRL
jgi:hypothetical protein